jgi:hypothetical protein
MLWTSELSGMRSDGNMLGIEMFFLLDDPDNVISNLIDAMITEHIYHGISCSRRAFPQGEYGKHLANHTQKET